MLCDVLDSKNTVLIPNLQFPQGLKRTKQAQGLVHGKHSPTLTPSIVTRTTT